ncbi:peptidoglycan DD-metalloendopeptidase family protein [Chryseobacterium wanjuense]
MFKNPDYIKVQTVSSGKPFDNEKVYDGGEIKEVVVKGKLKRQYGVNPVVDTGNKVVTVFKPEEKKKEKEEACECEARVRAFMRMLRFKEGTEKEIGYTTQYSKKQFSDFSSHPQEVITDSKGKHSSSAAGAYQIMTDTWKNLTGYYKGGDKKWHYAEKLDYAKKYKITSFDQESQDKFCLVIMKHNYLQDRADSFYDPTYWKNKEKKIHDTVKEAKEKEWRKRFKGQQGDIVQMIIDNDIKRAALISSLCWASLPDSPYGQQSSVYTFAIVKAIYEKNLREELIEWPSKELHLKKGFLKEFGYGCCGDEVKKERTFKTRSKCPEDCSQCFDYEDVISNPKINNQSGNRNHNRYHNEARTRSNGTTYFHSGTDILAAVGTEVHSMMCGEVVHIRQDLPQNDYVKGYEGSSSYGNTITIRSKDKDGKIVYHFYAHLSKVNVKVGETVKHNKIIGLSGSTGNAMHVEVKYRHVHVEAGTSYSTTGGKDGKQRCKINANVNPENYMKSKFDNKGNTL